MKLSVVVGLESTMKPALRSLTDKASISDSSKSMVKTRLKLLILIDNLSVTIASRQRSMALLFYIVFHDEEYIKTDILSLGKYIV